VLTVTLNKTFSAAQRSHWHVNCDTKQTVDLLNSSPMCEVV